MTTTLPPVFGRYRVVRALGEGAMGTVVVAHDEVLGRDVAIKAIRPQAMPSGGVDRFFAEARAVAQLAHPNVVRIFDLGQHEGAPYLVMELAPGGTLKARLQAAHRLRVDEVRTLGIQLAQALGAAHARAIVHRDVKPANILLAHDGMWKLADFGIAHLPGADLTTSGQFLGSPAYAAPESLRAGVFGAASDLYALGATLFEALTGRALHGGRGIQERLAADDDPARWRAELDHVAPSIAGVILRCLERAPAARPTANELATLLASASTEPVASAAVPVTGAPASDQTIFVADSVIGASPRRRRRILIACAIVASVLLLALLAGGGGKGGAAATVPPSGLGPAVREPAREPVGADPWDETRDEPAEDEPPPWSRGHGKHKKLKVR